MNKCEECEETFYSDTEFREHRFYHLLEKQVKGTGELPRMLAHLADQLRLLLVDRIKEREHLSLEEATRVYLTYGDMFNKVLDEARAKHMEGAL